MDGRVTEVCASETDSARDVNLKRGILSTFQTSFDGKYDKEEEDEVKQEITNKVDACKLHDCVKVVNGEGEPRM